MNTTRRLASLARTLFGTSKPSSPAPRRRRPGRLAACAGWATGQSAMEQLEERQLLFTLTIGPADINPATGLGTRTVDFSYYVPYLAETQLPVQPGMVQNALENFDDEMGAWTQRIPAVPPNGTHFDNSRIQISYQTSSTAWPQLFAHGAVNPPDFALYVAPAQSDTLTFTFFDPMAMGGSGGDVPRLIRHATFLLSRQTGILPSDGGDLNTDPNTGTKVELLSNGVVVRTYSGLQLDAIRTAAFERPLFFPASLFTFDFAAGFDAVRFSSAAMAPQNATYSDNFSVEEIDFTLVNDVYVDKRVRDVRLTFSGPVGATVTLLDLYGRDMRQVDCQRVPSGSMFSPIDPNVDRVPDFNDGIGRVIIAGTNALSSLTMVGYTCEITNGQPNKIFPNGPGNLNDVINGLDFGHEVYSPNGNQLVVDGLPPIGVSLIIGSPFLRDNSSPPAYLQDPAGGGALDFNRADQGVFVTGGASIGNVLIMGAVYGSSHIEGAAQRFAVGYMAGSLRVDGDVGSFTTQTDCGSWWSPEFGAVNTDQSRITFGRTVREVAIGGRNLATVTVLADVNNQSRARLSERDYISRETVYGFNPATQNGGRVTIGRTITGSATWFNGAQATPFGVSYYRNDTISSAEFVGYNGTSVRIFGAINGRDPVNTFFDSADVYAFPADPTREVVIAVPTRLAYVRVVNRDGLVVAALDASERGRGPGGVNIAGNVFRFRPDHRDVYYLVVNSDPPPQRTPTEAYQLTITGMAPVTAGAFRTAAGSAADIPPYVFTLSAGDMGSVRLGTGYYRGDGMESDDTDATLGLAAGFANMDFRRYLGWGPSTFSVPGTLFNMVVGGSVNGGQLLVRGDLGALVTGTFTPSIFNGDLINADIRVGGSIALMDIKGAMAVEQLTNAPDDRSGAVFIVAGTVPGRRGDIGQVLIGAYMHGGPTPSTGPFPTGGVTIRTSAGSRFDQLIVGANNDGAGTEHPGEIIDNQPDINVGDGSDVRFVTFTHLSLGTTDLLTRVVFGGSVQVVDDAGATVTISIGGGSEPADPNNDPRLASFADIRLLRINGSRGYAIGRIDTNLQGGASLSIAGVTAGVVSIGRIVIADAESAGAGGPSPVTPAPNPTVDITGSVEVDVNRIDQADGLLDGITNSTPGGDIVAIDAAGLRSINIHGNLGRTQLSPATNALLGPFLGLSGQAAGGTGIGGPIALNPAGINAGGESTNWVTNAIFAPVTNPGLAGTYPTMGYLEDVGSPVDPFLNGVIVRGGDLENVSVDGTVGDVIVQGNAHLLNLVANADGLTPQGDFQGIEGNVYARAIGSVDVGDGLRGTGPSPFAAASIVADQAIINVTIGGTRIRGAVDQGVIAAAGVGGALTQLGTSVQTPTMIDPPLFGIGQVVATNALYDTALIYGGAIDDFWHSVRVLDADALTTNINTVSGVTTDLFRSHIGAANVAAVTLTGGAYDATITEAAFSIGAITADEFRNTTRLGTAAEAYPNLVKTGRNLTTLMTNGLAGDISDLNVDLGQSLTGEASARNIQRSSFDVVNITTSIRATNEIRSTSVQSGRLINFAAGTSIRSSSLVIAGPVESVTAGDEITQLLLNSSGPDGRVDLLRAQNLLQADVTSSGNIGTIQSVTNDVQGTIITRNDDVRANNGGLATLSAGRDLLVSLSILGDTGTITATRNVGAAGVLNPDLDLRGNLGSLTATNGQIYSDLLVGQSITGTVTTGRVNMKPGHDLVANSSIVAFGRINALVFNSDFDGDIISRSGGIGSITFNSSSFRPGHAITVNNGDLTTLTFNGGDLLGDVLVDGNIGDIEVLVGPDGFKGQIGIASWRRNFRAVNGDPLRNELPPGVQRSPDVDGVTIRAGGSINRVFVERGSMTESQIIAGTTIGTVDIALQLRNDSLNTGLNNAIIAGDRIESVHVGGFVGAVAILAGVIDLGADGRVGGVGADADTVKSGSIGTVVLNSNGVARTVNSVVSAGIAPNDFGQYNKPDSKAAVGRSSIDSVSAGHVVNVSAFAAGTLGTTSAGIVRGGTSGLAPAEPGTIATNSTVTEVELSSGVAFSFRLPSNERGVATFTGPGKVWYDPAQGRFRLANTTTGSTLTIVPNGQFLTDLTILGNANTALGTLSVAGTVRGASTIFINGDVNTLALGTIDSAGGLFGSGGNVNTITTLSFLAGSLRARNVGAFTVNGDFGRSTVDRDAFADLLSVTSVSVTGAVSGAISSDRGIPTFTAGSFNNGGVRSGTFIGTVTSGPMTGGRISARTSINSVTVNGDVLESQILGGADLGHDADFGGAGRDADVVGSGSIATVTINGNFRKSDIGAGVLAGPSGFLGNSDRQAAAGRSSIGTVTITGTQVGSTLNSEQYRILSTGTIGSVTVGGTPFTGTANFKVERIAAVAVPVRVIDLFVTENSRIFTASIVFNQPVDVSTLSGALTVVELRNSGSLTVGLAEGTDYTLSYDSAKNTLKVIFSRSVTERNLPQTPGLPGPGVYQFILSAGILRGSTQDSVLDGNEDGVPGDDFARNAIVGDAGDKIAAGHPAAAPNIDFYGAADLDLVLRRQAGIGVLPDTNTDFTIRGSIGDHPDSDPDIFRLGGDVDVYRITLRAGQILRMGAITGAAIGAVRGVFDASGNLLAANSAAGPGGGAPGSDLVRLPNNPAPDAITTSEDQYLIARTGTYYIVIAGTLNGVSITDPDAIQNVDPIASAFGLYSFNIRVFDDQNTGFVGDTGSGTAAALVNPPTPIVFAGVDGIFGNGDDLSVFTQGDWRFTLTPGPNGPNRAGAVVTGVNSQGWVVTRTAAPNGTFGSANDRISFSIRSSIGLPGAAGVPTEVSPDVDVYSLNNGMVLAPGTKIRATLRLTKTGSNIGLDFPGHAQFAIFETPAGTTFNNAKLVAAPSAFLPIGSQAPRTITDGRNSYGYDAQGDFFMEFIVPGAQGVGSSVPASYALYVQGAVRSDYTLEIVQQGTGSTATLSQNVLIETQGGTINWLEAGKDITTTLAAFSTSAVGFTGQINGLDVDTYVLNNLLANLNALFQAANVNVTFSTNPNDFAHQPFSAVILAGNVEPSAFFGNQSYGASQHADFFNVDRNDQAVVFTSSLADLGFEPSDAGVDAFVTALTGAVARRVGELIGLRLETNVGTPNPPVPVMAADSVQQFLGGSFGFNNTTRSLAGLADNATNTVFYMGTQNAGTLIQRVVVNRA